MAAIRINLPNPPAHARNLHHLAVAMYDAWAAYDTTAIGYIYNEKISPLPADIEAARHEAISYAAYRLLRARFVTPVPAPQGAAATSIRIDAKLAALGYSTAIAQAATTNDPTPAELGKRIGQAILTWGATDGFSLTAYPQAYDVAVNPNMVTVQDPNNPPPAVIFPRAMSVLGDNGEPLDQNGQRQHNMPLGVGLPLIADTEHQYTHDTNPSYWQPLALSASVTQNGIPTPGGAQAFVGVQGLAYTPFSLTRTDPLKPWIDIGPPSSFGSQSYKDAAMDNLRKSARLNDPTVLDFSPGAYGNNSLGNDDGTGHPVNPVTSLPYASNFAKVGDFFRVLAEFWADGPHSETPPGHWHVLFNDVSDNPLTVKKIGGVGPTVNDLEWDVKGYFALSGATHDAACEAWSLKRYYNGMRPITIIRYLASVGELPLEDGVVEAVTAESSAPGERHEYIWNVYLNDYDLGFFHQGEVVIYSYPGEGRTNPPAQLPPLPATTQNTVRWMFATDWLPFQRKTFNTPAFPGYISGHSTFSRAAAEALTLVTGSPLFPGGFGHYTIAADSMQIDKGPSVDVDLQWSTYYDAADQAGQSRRWGGIHPSEDDYPARVVGSQVGKSAFALAKKFWTGAIANEFMQPVATVSGGNVILTWKAVRGMKHKVQTSTDLVNWTDATTYAQSYVNGAIPGDTSGTWTDTNPGTGQKFYRIVRSTSP